MVVQKMVLFHVRNILFIIIGATILALGIVNFNMQNNLGEGGFTGITLLLYFLFNINPAISYFVLNIPLFWIGWKLLDKTSFIYTVIGTITVTVFLNIFQHLTIHIDLRSDMTLAALFAGLFSGIGLGIIFRAGGTSGGIDIIARILNDKLDWPIGKTMFTFDAVIIMTSILTTLTAVQGMYTIVAVYISARVIDLIQEGTYAARGVFIITKRHEELVSIIHYQLNRGVTIIEGVGGYTKQSHGILYCIVHRGELIHLKNIIKEIDEHAFVTVFSVNEVIGEGFKMKV